MTEVMIERKTFCPRCKGLRCVFGGKVKSAFSLIELLTVVFIIALLIAILIPSLNSARNLAKKTSTTSTLRSLETSLDLFRNDNERNFPQTNGYPPSFAHPKIPGVTFIPRKGEFPFIEGNPVVMGAQWLPAMLMGVDGRGHINRRTIPKKNNLPTQPWRWYVDDPLGTDELLQRKSLYADPENLKVVRTMDLVGKPNLDLFPDWETMKQLPVIVDAFDQPILYYAADRSGSERNMVADERKLNNLYTGGPQEKGSPIYFHDDNHGFTGDEEVIGWDFDGPHAIAKAGDKLDAVTISDPTNLDARNTFARFIIDRVLLRDLEEKTNNSTSSQQIKPTTPLKPVNKKTFLLISAGVDGIWGTRDDVTNFPRSVAGS